MKKAISAASLLLLFVMLFTACGNANPPDPGSTSAPEASATVEPVTTEETTTDYLPATDLGNYEYRMLVSDNDLWVPMHFSENDTEIGQAVDDALLRREVYLAEKYKCRIEHTIDSYAVNKVIVNVGGGSDLCEAVFVTAVKTASLFIGGYITDLATVDGLALDKPWWDQRINSEYMIGSRIFMADGEINIRDDLRTVGIVYNKEVYEDYKYNEKYGTPYSLVAEGKWTFDLLMEMIKDKTENPNDATGVWGMLSENAGPYYFFLGSGYKTFVNTGGEFKSNLDDENILNSFQKVLEMVTSTDVMIVNDSHGWFDSDTWGRASALFEQGNVLFRSTTLSAVKRLFNMKQDYGILPIPNVGGGSKDYYCYVSGTENSPVSIPRNVGDIDKAAFITEALAYYSLVGPSENFVTLHGAFYELLGNARLARTADDVGMLDIIFSSKTYDIDQVLALSGLESSIYSIAKGGNVSGLSASVTAARRMASRKVEQFVNGIQEKYPD